jgi:methylenetetrahydrofolate reductase (NADPH)
MAPDTRIIDLLEKKKPVLSLEFFPPKTEEAGARIVETAQLLGKMVRPDFVSITYGAGGSTRERTRQYAGILREQCGFRVMPHLTCVGSTKDEILQIVKDYAEAGFRNIMALRGDPPKGQSTFVAAPDGLAYASDLVALLKEHYPEICLGVGGYPEVHPEAPDLETDLRNLSRKVENGADFITTQLFFDNQDYFRFVEGCRSRNLDCPIVPGLLPVVSLAQVERFCGFCGAKLPEELRRRLQAVEGNPETEEAVGVEWALEQIAELLKAGIPGVHLYILNRASSAITLCERLRSLNLLPQPNQH